jgi:N-acetylneuraminate synthase
MEPKLLETMDITIDGKIIGANNAPYIIAEMSCNHNGDIKKALSLIESAKKAGADAIKIQTYTADTMTIDSKSEGFVIKGGLWDGYSLYQLYEEAHTPWEWHAQLFKKAKEVGITLFSSPFDSTAVNFLEELECPAYKIASFELLDIALIKKVASTGKPMIMSTGMASLDEIKEAVVATRESGCKELAIMHCVSGYPTPVEEANLNTLLLLQEEFDVVVGLSDHTTSTVTSIASIALGARVIEKHFVESHDDETHDAAFSIDSEEMKLLTSSCREAFEALGKGGYNRKESEEGSVQFRRSLYIVKDIEAGAVFSKENIRAIRPGFGLKPKLIEDVIGKKAKTALKRGTPLALEMIE